MTQKQIERKGQDYSKSATPSFVNGTFDRYVIAQAFEDAAKWRIESVWHENTIKPNKDCHVLLEDIFGNIYDDEYCAVCDEFDSSIEWKEIKRWAYIKDLLPEE